MSFNRKKGAFSIYEQPKYKYSKYPEPVLVAHISRNGQKKLHVDQRFYKLHCNLHHFSCLLIRANGILSGHFM